MAMGLFDKRDEKLLLKDISSKKSMADSRVRENKQIVCNVLSAGAPVQGGAE